MNIVGLVGAVVMAIAAFAYVAYPLFKPEPAGTKRKRALLADANTTFAWAESMEELEIDRRTGRLSAEDYTTMIQSTLLTLGQPPRGAIVDDEIEQRVRALRQQRAKKNARAQK